MARKLSEKDLEEIREAVNHGVVVTEDPTTSALVTLMEREADAELLGGTVTLRWGKQQIDVVKRAAAILGVPYQTYLKQVVFNKAIDDIARAEAVLQPSEMNGITGKSKPAARSRRKAAASG